ncbi:alpha/beta hydrolase [Clostridium sp. CF011]|uniref:alpha/beta hydrolase n=1 Tax=Clostridium sp. CF011 TaxID=2843318 RepID=UPI001C0CE81D|nr:alpha/beta hydrolase [Clostridium sp. CF011]MBU3093537.1 alpha/beta hydrolase [Clostridium sp. CF011]WAG71727.1 alpha/beta hydrolase [Clostridium sp. CF011]
MKIISNIADSYGLYSLHKKYSEKDQFNYVEEEVITFNSDFSKFYKKPTIPKLYYEKDKIEKDYEIGKIKFLSEVGNGYSNKDTIFHYRKNLVADNNINVIFVHGWRAEDLNRLEKVFLDSFIERRYNIYNYVLPFHMERSPDTSLYSGEYFVSADVNRTLKSEQQAVSDIRALINYIKTEKKGKVIIIGLSLGGITTNLLSEVEENIDVLISLFYANDLSYTIFETEAGKYIKKDFFKNNFNYSLLKKSWKIINPSLRKPVIDLSKILLVSGKYDKYVIDKDTDVLWKNWGKPKRYVYSCGHSGIVFSKNKIKKDVLEFIDKRV